MRNNNFSKIDKNIVKKLYDKKNEVSNKNNSENKNINKKHFVSKDLKIEDIIKVNNDEMVIYGKNTVLDLLKQNVKLKKVIICKDNKYLKEINDIIQKQKINNEFKDIKNNNLKIEYIDEVKTEKIKENHQNIFAVKSKYNYSNIDEIINYAKSKNEKALILILDKINDVNNFGAIIRSAEVFGVHGIVIPDRNSVEVNSSVYKMSSSAVENMKIVKVKNINYLIDELKEKDFWIYATKQDAKNNLDDEKYDNNVALIIGSEGEGISELTLKKSDIYIKIPMVGKTESLNASVSAAICIYNIQKNRGIFK